jgi:ATP-dependent DNA ligase
MRDKGNMRTRGPHGLDSIVVVYYRGKELVYVARVRNGFVSASRRQLFEKLKLLVISKCPFVNLPEKYRSRWGERMTVDEMNKCVWFKAKLVAQIDSGPTRTI